MDKKKQEPGTKERIFETAVQLFAEKGYSGTSMRDLGAAVGIKESTLYYHYPSKGAILDAVLEYYVKGFQSALPAGESLRSTADRFTDATALWLHLVDEILKRQPPFMQRVATVLLNEMLLNGKCREFVLNTMFRIQKEATELLLAELERRGLIRDCDIGKTAAGYVYMLHGLDIESRLLAASGGDSEEIRQNFMEHITFFVEGLKVRDAE